MATTSATTAATPDEYIAQLPADRQPQIQALREVVLRNLPAGFEEGIQYNMIGYYVPHSVYPAGYHCDPKQPLPYLSIGSQKNHMALHACTIYMNPELVEWFMTEYQKTGKRMDIGKGCIRFKTIEDLPLDLVGQLVAKYDVDSLVAMYQNALATRAR